MQRLNLSRLFNIWPGEWPRLSMLYAMFFIFIIGYTWSVTILEATFLRDVGINFLAVFMTAKGLISLPAIAIYAAFADRVSNKRLLIAILLIGAGGMCVGLGLLGLGWARAGYALLYLLAFVPLDDILGAHWLIYVSSFYDTRAAKRILPILGTSLSIASILAGLTVPLITGIVSVASVIVIWISTTLTMAVMAQLMDYWIKERRSEWQPHESVSPSAPTPAPKNQLRVYVDNIGEGAQYVLQSPFLRWMTLSTLLVTTLLTLLQYETSIVLLGELGSLESIANFIGVLTGVSNLIILPIQLFFLSRLIGRVGLGNASLIYPASMVPLSVSLLAFPNLASAAGAYMGRTTFFFTIGTVIDSLLYNAVPLSLKARSRAFIGGLITPVGSLVGGALLLLALALSLTWLVPWVIVVAAVAYLLSNLAVRRHYGQALIDMLARDDFSFMLAQDARTVPVADPAMLKELQRRLEESTSSELTIFVAKLISEISSPQSIPILVQAVRSNADPRVRGAIVDIIAVADARSEMAHTLFNELLDDPHVPVRLAAINGLEQFFRSDTEQFLSHVSRMMADPDDTVRARVLPAYLRAQTASYQDMGLQLLDDMLRGDDVFRRVLAVQAMGSSDETAFIPRLLEYAHDSVDEIRLAVAVAVEALVQDGVPAEEALFVSQEMKFLMHDPVERVRQAALVVLGKIETLPTYATLIDALTDSSRQIRRQAVDTLVNVGRRAMPEIVNERTATTADRRKMVAVVLSRIDREHFAGLITSEIYDNLVIIYRNYTYLDAIEGQDTFSSVPILRRMLIEQNESLLDELFYLLVAIHATQTVKVIEDSFHSSNPFTRANAAEALEVLTTGQIANLTAPLFEPDSTLQDKVRISAETWNTSRLGIDQVLQRMIVDSSDPWFRAVGIFMLGQIGAATTNTSSAGDDANRSVAASTTPTVDDFLESIRFRRARAGSRQRQVPPAPQPRAAEAQAPTSSGERFLSRIEIARLLQNAQGDPVDEVQIELRAVRQMLGMTDDQPVPDLEQAPTRSNVERIIFLKGVPFFRDMTVEQLKVLATVCEEKLFATNDFIFRQGDSGGTLYMVVDGQVAIEVVKRKSVVTRLATIDAGSAFGEYTLFDRTPRTASAVALQKTLTLQVRREPVIALARQYPDLSFNLIKVLSEQQRSLDIRIADLTRTLPRELHRLFDQYG